jgi:hypothetical protein
VSVGKTGPRGSGALSRPSRRGAPEAAATMIAARATSPAGTGADPLKEPMGAAATSAAGLDIFAAAATSSRPGPGPNSLRAPVPRAALRPRGPAPRVVLLPPPRATVAPLPRERGLRATCCTARRWTYNLPPAEFDAATLPGGMSWGLGRGAACLRTPPTTEAVGRTGAARCGTSMRRGATAPTGASSVPAAWGIPPPRIRDAM